MDNNSVNNFLNLFLTTAGEHLKRMQQILFSQEVSKPEVVEELHRHAHSLKGEFVAMNFLTSGELAHLLELIFAGVKTGSITLSPGYASLLQESLEQLQASLKNIATQRTELDLSEWTLRLMKETGVNLPETKAV